MKEYRIDAAESGQRLDRLLERYMKNAQKSFFYRMMRKKNITLNGKKVSGSEKVQAGDVLRFYFSDDTWEKMGGLGESPKAPEYPVTRLDILYEDDHVLFINKPAGMLSQKARPDDVSLVEYLMGYLASEGSMDAELLERFHPSICNRLDRNTSGIVAAGKTNAGLSGLGEMIASRSVRKFYRAFALGRIEGEQRLEGYLVKDERTNQVSVSPEPSEDSRPICTVYRSIFASDRASELEIELVTGRTHQIRAHLASIGHPLIGDMKYGKEKANRYFREKCGIRRQMLHAARMEFPACSGALAALDHKCIEAPVPADFIRLEKFCRCDI